jgi:hypothetical protein
MLLPHLVATVGRLIVIDTVYTLRVHKSRGTYSHPLDEGEGLF